MGLETANGVNGEAAFAEVAHALLEGDLVGAELEVHRSTILREAEDPLGDDVALDLAAPGGDGERRRSQTLLDERSRPQSGDVLSCEPRPSEESHGDVGESLQ